MTPVTEHGDPIGMRGMSRSRFQKETGGRAEFQAFVLKGPGSSVTTWELPYTRQGGTEVAGRQRRERGGERGKSAGNPDWKLGISSLACDDVQAVMTGFDLHTHLFSGRIDVNWIKLRGTTRPTRLTMPHQLLLCHSFAGRARRQALMPTWPVLTNGTYLVSMKQGILTTTWPPSKLPIQGAATRSENSTLFPSYGLKVHPHGQGGLLARSSTSLQGVRLRAPSSSPVALAGVVLALRPACRGPNPTDSGLLPLACIKRPIQ